MECIIFIDYNENNENDYIKLKIAANNMYIL